jgi:hypothetical protein
VGELIRMGLARDMRRVDRNLRSVRSMCVRRENAFTWLPCVEVDGRFDEQLFEEVSVRLVVEMSRQARTIWGKMIRYEERAFMLPGGYRRVVYCFMPTMRSIEDVQTCRSWVDFWGPEYQLSNIRSLGFLKDVSSHEMRNRNFRPSPTL